MRSGTNSFRFGSRASRGEPSDCDHPHEIGPGCEWQACCRHADGCEPSRDSAHAAS